IIRRNRMAAEPVCCPYCNAYVVLPGGRIEAGQRLLCSRCGETFAFRGEAREAVDGAASLASPMSSSQSPPAATATQAPIHRPLPNRVIAGVVLGGMATMAVVGVLFSVSTQGIRRDHDSGVPKDRTLPLYLAVFVGIWLVGLAFVAVRELRVRYQKSYAAQKLPLGYVLATVPFLALGGLPLRATPLQHNN